MDVEEGEGLVRRNVERAAAIRQAKAKLGTPFYTTVECLNSILNTVG